ncbi:ABC transporter ATP-binding protein [Carnobacterium gallinarum]|uniref:ABC transporter ATP-binding protein n=1 Tax=Carnobacterium gallinarum TaxID=2749 RepID=UPI0006917EEB|nr:ABC transporter ATP-binding protein [Carnobacterium gallinarum]
MIEIHNLYKSFGEKEVLTNINMNVANGKITSLVGKNGAGKSTIIGIIANYMTSDKGSIKKESVSIMPDADNLFSDMTGRYFLTFMEKLKNKKETYKEWEILCKELGLEHSLDKKIKEYSFGMKKKISFIQTCIGQYDTYVFDEPTSGVDVHSSVIMMGIIEELKGKSAVLLTSHNMDEIERVSDYIYFLEGGTILKHGTTKQIIDKESRTCERYYVIETSNADEVIEYLTKIENVHVEKNNTGVLLLLDETISIQSIIFTILSNKIKIDGFWEEKKSLQTIFFKQE